MRVLNEKFSKYSHLVKEDKLAPHLPETKILSEDSFYEFVNKYYQVYLRPCLEEKIIILVTSLKFDLFEIESGSTKVVVDGQQAAYHFIENKLLNQKRFIIQQGIPRTTIDESHFDIRVFVIREPSNWRIAERVAQLTTEGFTVTDDVKEVFPVKTVIPRAYLGSISVEEVCSQIDKVAICTAEKLAEKYPKYDMIIIDFVLDKLGKPWINEVRYKFLEGKWDMHQVLRGESELFPYLPHTCPFHEKILLSQLKRNGNAIIKPYISQWGLGLALISQLSDQTFEIHSEKKKFTFTTFTEVISTISDRFLSKKLYIIQEKIPLGMIDGSPFDLRVMVQRKSITSDWVITGKMARTAANGFIVTNVAKSLSSVEEAIEKSTLTLTNVEALLWEIDRVCLLIAGQLEKVYPRSRKWGIDIGIDQNGKPWIIEANRKPDISLFYYLTDKSMYQTIKKYARGE